MACLRTRLVADKDLGPMVAALSTLRTEAMVGRLLEEMDALYEAVSALRGLPEERVKWPVTVLQDPAPRAYILLPKYRLLPYMGSPFQEVLSDLLTWARGLEEKKGKVGLRLYTGPGGSGKTRLLIEAGERLRAEGWWAGFLTPGPMGDDLAERLVTDPRPTLLVVDYIAARQAEVQPLLLAAARVATGGLPSRATPLALILLERQMPAWLEEMLRSVSDFAYVGWPEFLTLPGVELIARELPPLKDLVSRQEFFQAVVELFCKTFSPPEAPVTYPAEALPERPLLLALLALHAALGARVSDTREDSILDFTWKRERDAWKRLLKDDLEQHGVAWAEPEIVKRAEKMAVLATLGRKFPDEAALACFLEKNFPPLRGAQRGQELDPAWLARRLPRLFPLQEGTVLPSIVPDPLAEFVIYHSLEKDPALLDLALPTKEEMEREPVAAAEMAWNCFTMLERMWAGRWREKTWQWLEQASASLEKRIQGGGQELFPFLEKMEEYLLRPGEKELFRVEPVRRITLWSLAVAVWSALRRLTPLQEAETRARLSVNLGYALSALGRREEALLATQEAVEIYRQLAQENPQAFLPDLARSLNNLGYALSALGRREEALLATQEAVGIYRQLAQENPQAFLPYLAMSLGAHGSVLRGLGRYTEAAQAFAEGLRAILPFVRALPAAFGKLTSALLEDYLQACEEAKQEPAWGLVEEVRRLLGAD